MTTMKRAMRTLWWAAIAALCFAPSAVSQTSVTLTSPPPGDSYDGIYVSPYFATVGGVANTAVVCDDFADETSIGSTWNATITQFSGMSSTNTAWGNAGAALTLYNPVAWLTLQVLQQTPGSLGQIIDSYALWAVFDPTGVESYLASHPITGGSLTTADLCDDIFGGTSGCTTSTASPGSLLYTAENQTYTTGEFANMEIIAPDITGSNPAKVCTAGTNCPAQEFISVVSEGGAALAYLFLAGLCCFGAMFLRSRRQVATLERT